MMHPTDPPTTRDERVVTVNMPGIRATGTNMVANLGVPTQVANPRRASWRTYVQAVVGFLIGANIVLPIVATFLAENIDGLSTALGPVYGIIVAIVNGAILVLGLLSKFVASLMAHPQVNAWITQHLAWLAPIRPE